jgi:hypothetical protein
MEFSLNLLWLLLAVASFVLAGRGGDCRTLSCRHSVRRILALVCVLVFVFPIISLTDDLHAAQVVMEDSNPLKRISRASGAPAGSSNFDRSSLPFSAVAASLLPIQNLRLLGLATSHEARYPIGPANVRANPRAPPLPV